MGKFVRGEYVDNFVSFSRRQEDSLRLVSAASAALESGVTLGWDFDLSCSWVRWSPLPWPQPGDMQLRGSS